MKWATRKNIHIDRAATAWLISSRIDPDATFIYVDDPADTPDDATPFDMVGATLTHRNDDVTFETVLRDFDLMDPVLWKIAQIVHQADVEDDRFDAPEAPGLDVVIRALSESHDDEEVRALSATIFEGLYHYFRDEAVNGSIAFTSAETEQ